MSRQYVQEDDGNNDFKVMFELYNSDKDIDINGELLTRGEAMHYAKSFNFHVSYDIGNHTYCFRKTIQ